ARRTLPVRPNARQMLGLLAIAALDRAGNDGPEALPDLRADHAPALAGRFAVRSRIFGRGRYWRFRIQRRRLLVLGHGISSFCSGSARGTDADLTMRLTSPIGLHEASALLSAATSRRAPAYATAYRRARARIDAAPRARAPAA